MGSGKTTIGRAIATQSSLLFFDSDSEIIQRSGVEISWIFEQEGEAGFRRREHEALKHLTKKTGIVLATGGGCVTIPKNLALLTQNGMVVYLQVSLTTQLQRLEVNKGKRPLFQANNSKEKLQKLNEQRHPLYNTIANFTYNTDTDSPQAIASHILSDWQKLQEQTGEK